MNAADTTAPPRPRADVAALVFAATFPFLAAWLYLVILAGHKTAVVQAAYGAAKVLQFAFPLLWVALVRRQRLNFHPALTPCPSPKRRGEVAALPCPAPARTRAVAGIKAGILFGITVATAMLLLYFLWLKPAEYLAPAASLIRVKASSFGMDAPLGFILGAILLSLIHSLLEEYYWRWFLFGGLQRYMPVTVAVALSSLAFAAHHVVLLASFFGGLTLPAIFFSLCVAIGGAVWAWLYHRSGSLLGPWLSHALIDAAIFAVGYDILFL